MKKQGILNADIAAVTAQLGHFDTICIADAGLPIPDHVQRIDLVVKPNLPTFLDVVAVLLDELVVQEVVLAGEMADANPQVHAGLGRLLGDIPRRVVTHDEFKVQTGACKAVIRTGEFSPYANVILVAGVAF